MLLANEILLNTYADLETEGGDRYAICSEAFEQYFDQDSTELAEEIEIEVFDEPQTFPCIEIIRYPGTLQTVNGVTVVQSWEYWVKFPHKSRYGGFSVDKFYNETLYSWAYEKLEDLFDLGFTKLYVAMLEKS